MKEKIEINALKVKEYIDSGIVLGDVVRELIKQKGHDHAKKVMTRYYEIMGWTY